MRRKIVNILTGASTVAFVVIAIVWGHSIGRWNNLEYERAPRLVQGISSDGVILLTVISELEPRLSDPPAPRWRWSSAASQLDPAEPIFRRIGFVGFKFSSDTDGGMIAPWDDPRTVFGKGWAAIFPLWPLCLATAILPTVRLIRWQRRRRRRQVGTCPTCGYDLRATPDRCPECGTTATPSLHRPT